MSSVGETLRRERLRAGLDLEKIAQDTKISVRTLELIETDQFDKLPGGVFTRSFVRQYARAVGLDEDEVTGELDKRLAPADPVPAMQEATRHPDFHVPRVTQWNSPGSRLRSNSSLPALGLVVLVIVACSAVYTWWQRSARTAIPAAPIENTQTAQNAKPVEPETQAQAPPSAPAPSETMAVAPASEPHSTESPAPNVSGTVTADAAGAGLHIALTAAEPTWVRATANGKVVFSGVIQTNETKDLSAPDTVTLRIGNAGGINISLNGKAIPAVGPKGQVRVVQLSPDGAVQVAPPTPKPQAPEEQTRSL